jgi:hypothetical protein
LSYFRNKTSPSDLEDGIKESKTLFEEFVKKLNSYSGRYEFSFLLNRLQGYNFLFKAGIDKIRSLLRYLMLHW